MHYLTGTLRFFWAGLLAVGLALLIIWVVLTLRSHQSGPVGDDSTDDQKLEILAGLRGTSTPSESEQRKTLNGLSAPESVEISEEEKLNILKGLQ